MKAEVTASTASGTVRAPSSKSAMQRYIAGALLSDGITSITSATFCDDTMAAIAIAETLGANVRITDDHIEITGGFNPAGNEIFCGESGLSARMFTPIAALHDRQIILSGKGSILKRPFDMVELPLRSLGVEVTSSKGFLPLTIRGPLTGGEISADGSVSSQFITGLLMALPRAGKDSKITVENLVSRPYIDLTISILNKFGITIENDNYSVFTLKGRQQYKGCSFSAEGDWSGAAFLLIMGAISGEVSVTGLDQGSAQADRSIMHALSIAGASLSREGNKISVKGGQLRSFEFDISDCPDLAPPLTVLAMACKGRSILRGAERLVAKESNRGATLEETMKSIGGKVRFTGNTIEIDGGSSLAGGTAGSHSDHRIAMALACAGLLCKKPVIIEGMECINKSYPGFIDDFKSLGGNLKLI
jgi:3-phosphoshikimate 1-carboxyvinyltransferase